MTALDLIGTAAPGTEDLLAAELAALGAADVVPGRMIVRFRGDLERAYAACAWSRVANRVLLPIARVEAASAEALYEAVRALPWQDHLGPDDTLAVDFTEHASAISHTRFGAQRVKDGIVDALRERFGRRPSVALEEPRVRVNMRIEGASAVVAIDLAGSGLHRRGYRARGTEAPLKENLAAAVLLRSRWPDAARDGAPLVDPMCGSGTLVIEAALIACDVAPGLSRSYFGFLGWRGHDPAAWERVRAEALGRRRESAGAPLVGSDIDARAIRTAQENAAKAGVAAAVSFEQRPLAALAPPAASARPGLVVVNPPYGERLGQRDELASLYAELGRVLKERFAGWTAHVLTVEELAPALGLSPGRTNTLMNGAIECRLLHCEVRPRRERPAGEGAAPGRKPLSAGAEAVANRVRKNLRKLAPWAEHEGVSCYRVYDADIPEYAAAVDRYEELVHVQEYAPPASIDPARARERFAELVRGVRDALGVPPARVFTKVRRRQTRDARYGKLAESGHFHEVREGGHRFLVNLADYLDTGLFLDSRLVRRLVGELAPGRRFLNLFAYTGTATVYAAKGGARSSVSVDMSRTYVEWAERNFRLNGLGRAHALVRADCLAYLAETRDRFDLVLLDPPTFSSSKRMEGTLDVQRDHRELVHAAARLLSPRGVLVFVTNFRRFKLDAAAFPELEIEDVSRATIPPDFARNARIHQAFRMTRRR